MPLPTPPPPSSTPILSRNLPPGLQYISPSEREEGGGGRQERGRREAIPALINIRHNRRERVSRDVRRWLFTLRETDYVQLKELHVCVTEREGEEESARENE